MNVEESIELLKKYPSIVKLTYPVCWTNEMIENVVNIVTQNYLAAGYMIFVVTQENKNTDDFYIKFISVLHSGKEEYIKVLNKIARINKTSSNAILKEVEAIRQVQASQEKEVKSPKKKKKPVTKKLKAV